MDTRIGEETRGAAYRLHLAGWSYRQIAEELGISRGSVGNAVAEGRVAEGWREDRDRKMRRADIDARLSALAAVVEEHRPELSVPVARYVDATLSIIRAQRQLHAVDVPPRSVVTVETDAQRPEPEPTPAMLAAIRAARVHNRVTEARIAAGHKDPTGHRVEFTDGEWRAAEEAEDGQVGVTERPGSGGYVLLPGVRRGA